MIRPNDSTHQVQIPVEDQRLKNHSGRRFSVMFEYCSITGHCPEAPPTTLGKATVGQQPIGFDVTGNSLCDSCPS
jgi:hypothetical protein